LVAGVVDSRKWLWITETALSEIWLGSAAMTVMSGIGHSAAQACLQRPMPSGDPAAVRAIAAQTGAVAEALRRADDRLRSLTQAGSTTWTGPGQRSFALSVEGKLPSLGTASTRYQGYCTVLLGYAAALDSTQPRLVALRRQLMDGCADSGVGWTTDPALENRLLQLANRFEQAWQEWDTAVRRCNRALSQVAAIDRDRRRHGMASFTHGVVRVLNATMPLAPLIEHPGLAGLSRTWSNLSNEFAVAGLVLLVVCPPAAGACFAAAAVTSAAALATDLVRAGKHEPGAGIGLIGLDALGALPGGRFIREGEQGVRAVRAIEAGHVSRLVPGGGLAAHEAAGGHTLAKHVGKPAAFLADRLRNEPNIRYSSSFYSRQHAEDSISTVLESRRSEIEGWLAGRAKRLELSANAPSRIGLTLMRGHDRPADVSGIVVRLRKDSKMPAGYRIQTAFPMP
jgi:uncharacterized protein YukE